MRTLVVGTAGHIDHGKSALVKALTGIDPDRLKEEQERGITIDLGFAHAAIGSVQAAFVDVPGHERFVRNMLAGAGGIDAVLLVVAADESVMPQTREHFEICRLLGIERGVVAVTKSDLVDDDGIELAALEIRDLVAGSFLEHAPIVPVSAKTGAGLDEIRDALATLSGGRARQARAHLVRLPIDRVFSIKGFGTVVTGTLVSGEVHEGDELTVFPAGLPVRVRGIQVHGRQRNVVESPARAALNLGGVDVSELSRGVTLATTGSLAVSRRFDARIRLVAGARPLRHGARVRVHNGTDEVIGRVALGAVRGAPDSAWDPVVSGTTAAIPSGGEAFVRVRLERPAVLTRGDRIVVRAFSPPVTIGGGAVLDPEASSGGLRKSATIARFLRIDSPDADTAGERFARVLLSEAGTRGILPDDLVRRGGLDRQTAEGLVGTLTTSDEVIRAGDRLFEARVLRAAESAVLATLRAYHEQHPLEIGMPREELRERVAKGAATELFDAAVARLSGDQQLKGSDRLALASYNVALSAERANAKNKVEQALRDAGLTPPDLTALIADTGLAATDAETLLHLLSRERRLMRVGGLWFHTEALQKLRGDIAALKTAAGDRAVEVDVGMFKARYGLSRKFAIPLLEWLDRERVTKRLGQRRVVL